MGNNGSAQSKGQKFVEAKLAMMERYNLTDFEIKNEPIRDLGVELLTLELSKATCMIARIHLERNEITHDAFGRLAKALVNNRVVKVLTYIHNAAADVVEDSPDNLIDTIHSVNAKVVERSLSGCLYLKEALATNQTLELLELEHNHLRDVNAGLIAQGLEANTSLTYCALKSNEIGEDGGCQLGKALYANPTLTTFDISDNSIGDAGCMAIMQALLSITTALKEVTLRATEMTEASCPDIRQMLESNRTLRVLNLRRNSIKDAGCVLIAEGLRTNSLLKKLHLASNGISNPGLHSLSSALEVNTSLEELYLEINNLEDESLCRFAEMLESNKSLRVADLRMNNFEAEGYARLADAMDKNDTLVSLPLSKSIIAAKASLERIEQKLRQKGSD